MKQPKIAIVYDWIDKWGGVERLLLVLHEIFPQAAFYTSYFDKNKANWAADLEIISSFIQRLPKKIRDSRIISLPFYPFAFESFDFKGYDIVLSVSSSFAKGIITRPETTHINICLSPTRFLWLYSNLYLTAGVKDTITKIYISYLKKWDVVATQRPDRIISISKTVQERVNKIYQRESEVIYPPFDIEYWDKIKSEIKPIGQLTKSEIYTKYKIINTKYYLVVSRLEPYKRIDLVIKSFNNLSDKRLIIIGNGSQYKKLKRLAGSNITFIQKVSDKELAQYYLAAEVLIIPQEEDFGYTALEAQFFNCPVIAYGKGGVTETLIDGKTGFYFEEQTKENLLKAMIKYDTIKDNLTGATKIFGPLQCNKFSKNHFKRQFMNYLSNIMSSKL